eukprot:2663514-Rhodomonas_salina.5
MSIAGVAQHAVRLYQELYHFAAILVEVVPVRALEVRLLTHPCDSLVDARSASVWDTAGRKTAECSGSDYPFHVPPSPRLRLFVPPTWGRQSMD